MEKEPQLKREERQKQRESQLKREERQTQRESQLKREERQTQRESQLKREETEFQLVRQGAPYPLTCHSLMERFDASLKTCLHRLCCEQLRQWHWNINPLLFAYRLGENIPCQPSEVLNHEGHLLAMIHDQTMALAVADDDEEGEDCGSEVLTELDG
ncbi:Zinc finger protein [Plakobranchus ocellatus]|uniref:Zinc finger protein n=1 Tax=Plakobranchus ocellatus TaxID=259542 RepID=A0AAV4BGU3_9GAST|nr:Zinc finger protein [Plakobranchus ocellatus]